MIPYFHNVFYFDMFQSVIQMKGFRSLGDGEEVEFESRPSDKGVEATLVVGVSGADCKGSDRRPIARKKFKKIRCVSKGPKEIQNVILLVDFGLDLSHRKLIVLSCVHNTML